MFQGRWSGFGAPMRRSQPGRFFFMPGKGRDILPRGKLMAELVNHVETEFILKEALNLSLPFHMHGAGRSVQATVKEIRNDALLMSFSEPLEKQFLPWEFLSVYFEFHGKDMTFRTKVIRQAEGELTLAYPDRMLRSLMRKHPRVTCPKGFSLEITLQNEKVKLDYPQCGEYSDVSLPDLREGFDVSSLNALIDSFRRRSSGLASESRVVLFKDRPPEGIEEKLVAHYGKTLFIPSTRSSLPSSDPYPDTRIITAELVAEYEGPDAILDGSRFERALISKIGRAINAEVWCPIQYYQYVVGYVYLANKADRPVSMDFSAVDCAWEFSRVLAFYLKTNDYFKSSQKSEPVSHTAGIVDLSASGCLLSIPHTTLAMRVKIGSFLDLKLDYPENSFTARGRVVRRYDDKNGAYYGVAFQDLKTADLRKLFPKIYSVDYPESGEWFGEASLGSVGPI